MPIPRCLFVLSPRDAHSTHHVALHRTNLLTHSLSTLLCLSNVIDHTKTEPCLTYLSHFLSHFCSRRLPSPLLTAACHGFLPASLSAYYPMLLSVCVNSASYICV